MTEAATRSAEIAFDTLGVHRVAAELDPRNRARSRSARGSGCVRRPISSRTCGSRASGATPAIYAILDHEWTQRCGSPPGTSTRSAARLPRLLPWLDERAARRRVPAGDQARRRRASRAARRELAARGYEVARHGEPALERRRDPVAGRSRGRRAAACPTGPASRTRRRARSPPPAAASGSSRVYVPNGRSPGLRPLPYKLDWLAALRELVARGPATTSSSAAT